MSSLADYPHLVGFFSYSREDDEGSGGRLSKFRICIQEELRGQLGRTKGDFELFQDKVAIAHGTKWESEINSAIAGSVFFIPIVTPTAIRSYHCKFEFDSFLAREKELGRSDLIFPIIYIPIPALNDGRWRQDPVLEIVGSRQYLDWQQLRHLDTASKEVGQEVEKFCANICRALERPWLSPDKRRQEADARQRADEEERRRQIEAEARQRSEKERDRWEAEAKRRAEQEQAFAAARRADVVAAVDAFLATYPEGSQTAQARSLRSVLVARDAACKVAIASNDPVVLKAFLKTYPTGSPAEQVRTHLRGLPVSLQQRRMRNIILSVCCLAVLAVLLIYVAMVSPPNSLLLKPDASSARQPGATDTPHVDLVTDCDRLAALPTDAQRPKSVHGLYFDEIDTRSAVGACREAVNKYPDIARFSFQLGRALESSGDYLDARKQYEIAAKLGSIAALTNIGALYRNGKGVQQDYAEARRWYEKAAATGDPAALNNIGELYDGDGVQQDRAEARRWYEKAAAAGNAIAMRNLGDTYRDGRGGVQKSVADARTWYQRAAAAGDAIATDRLASLPIN